MEVGKKVGRTYPQILISSLLILLIHRPGRALPTHPDRCKETERDQDPDYGVAGDLPGFAWGWEGAWAVGAEGDVVCC